MASESEAGAVLSEMEEPDSKEKKHATKAVTSEPQEEFIEPKARPSRPEESSSAGDAEKK